MTNSTTRTTKTSAVFLAAVLVAGTFALISPSFMGGAEAYPDYGMEKKYKSKYPSHSYDSKYKSKDFDKKDFDKKVIIKKVKCNNININVNGLEIGDISRTTDALGASGLAAEENDLGAQAFGNNDNGNDFNIKDNFVFVCINNNNNAGQGPPTPPFVPEEVCDCFDPIRGQEGVIPQGLRNQLNDYLADPDTTVTLGGDNAGNVGSVEGLCALIEQRLGENNPGTQAEVESILAAGFAGNPQVPNPQPIIDRVIECLLSLDPVPIIPTNGD